jgi:dihydroorotate dehydrogenase (NAD+) catalytic subunit
VDSSQLATQPTSQRTSPLTSEPGDYPTHTSDLSVNLLGVKLRNPTILASGILGLSEEVFGRLAESGIGAITTKSCSLKPRSGYHNPTIVDWGEGLINAVGLSNPGVEVMVEEIREAKKHLQPIGVPIVASIFADTVYDFGTMARYISEAEPDLIEVNISCPNLDARFEQMFAASPYVAAQVTRRVKSSTKIPILVKLSANVESIVAVAKEVIAAGADGLTVINSLGPGMVIDIDSAYPVLANKWGGVSGPAIRPIAVKCVRDVAKAVPGVTMVGTGGVTTARDAIEMLLVGATAVGIGSAINWRGLGVFGEVAHGIGEYMLQHQYATIDTFRGKALAHC